MYRVMTNSNGKLLEQLIVPASMVRYVIRLNHEPPFSGHLGVIKTLGKLQVQFYWKDMAKDVRSYIKKCKSCQERKNPVGKKVAPLQPFVVAQRPFDLVSMDILGPLPTTLNGNRYLLIFTDYLTRWVEAIPLVDQKAETIAREFVTQILLKHGVPTRLLTDCGSNFLSKMMRSVYEYFGIKKLSTTPYHPAGNGLVERFNRTLTEMLSHYTDDQRAWDEFVPFVVFAYRTAPQASTGESPFYLMYGRDANLPFDDAIRPQRTSYAIAENYKEEMAARLHKAFSQARENLKKAAERSKHYYDKKSGDTDIRVGDMVLVYFPQVKPGQVAKLARRWIGPYRVLKQISPVNFELSKVGSTKTEIIHVNRMKRFFPEGYQYEEVAFEDDEDKHYAPLFPRETHQVEKEGRKLERMSPSEPGEIEIEPSELKAEILSSDTEEDESALGFSEAPEPPPLPPRQDELPVPPRPAPKYSLRSRGPVEQVEWVMPTPTRHRATAEKHEDESRPVQMVRVGQSAASAEPTMMDKLVWLVQALGR